MSGDSRQAFYDAYMAQKIHNAPQKHRGRRVLELFDRNARSVVDAGCAEGELLEVLRERFPTIQRAVGIDMAASVGDRLAGKGLEGVQGDAGAAWPFGDATFDVAICTEVIEHVFDTDCLVREAFRVLRPGGSFIVTTPNLAYLLNRFLLLFGVQPVATETSTSKLLGRWLPIFGQHRGTEGHLRIFTAGALQEILTMHGFVCERLVGCGFPGFEGPIERLDRTLAIALPRMAFGLAVRARKPG
jgi:SAM-dependent methyltransferase